MLFPNCIVEFEGPVVDVRARYWAAHREAIEAVGFDGPAADEFWRLVRTGAPDATIVRIGKPHHVDEYARRRDERINSTELMALDTLQPAAAENLRLLKQNGSCHLVTLCDNREGINATLDRLDVWMHFDQKQVLPADRTRRVDALQQLTGEHRVTVAVVGTVSMAYAGGEAGCRLVGIKGGPAFPKRLREVGVDVFYADLDELTDALARRDPELQRAGIF